ncbi:hypothetical protein B0H14DRAFT_2773744 [Mycena olivaceomarginata]|nr:hypothetical protein B0H14DRAFT_2773744 [Mycena olivaceomarginata]
MRCFAPKQVWVILVIILCRGEAFQTESRLLAACAGSARAHLGQCTKYLLKEAGDSLPEVSSLPILSGSQICSPPNGACSGSISFLLRPAVFLPDATIELGIERERAVSSASCALLKNFSSRRHARARSFTG